MSRSDGYTPEQRRELTAALKVGDPLACPLCASALDRREVPPRPDVSYVRDRVWVTCPACHRSAVLDRREPL